MNEINKPGTQPTKQPEKKVQKVVTGTVKTKKNDARKLADIFISEDIANVKDYILMDVIVPMIKKGIVEAVSEGISMIFGMSRSNSGRTSTASKVSYNKYYDDRNDPRDRAVGTTTRTGYSYTDITLETRSEAEEVLAAMDDLIETYGHASVLDLYDLVGITGNFTDDKYGWTNLRNAEPVRVNDGFLLKLPRVRPIG